MLLKTYQGPDLATALATARAEMGPDALVLATRDIPGRFGLKVVEVTVGAQRRETIPGQEAQERVLQRLAREVGSIRERWSDRAPRDTVAAETVRESGPESRPSAGIERTVTTLVASGLADDLARRFALAADRELRRGGGSDAATRATGNGMSAVLPFGPLSAGSSCVFVVGPPGCGKTTTVAKLAARWTLETEGEVFFAETDLDRIGAVEQAEIYARHLGTAFATVGGPDDLLRLLKRTGRGGKVLVDTAGVGSRDVARLEQLRALRAAAPTADVVVLIPAGLHRDEAARVLERFQPLEPTRIAFSRVDDGRRIGELVTAAAGRDIPLAFVTNGHRVPDDLEAAEPARFASMLLRSGRTARRGRESS